MVSLNKDKILVNPVTLLASNFDLPIYYSIFGEVLRGNKHNREERSIILVDQNRFRFTFKYTEEFSFQKFIDLCEECSIKSNLELLNFLFEEEPNYWELQ